MPFRCSDIPPTQTAGRRQITEPDVLPYLIEGLYHPDKTYVAQYCLDTLVHLTRQASGQIECFEQKQVEIWNWWRNWYEKNKDKHPIYDIEFESEIHARLTNALTRIQNEVERDHRVVHSIPTEVRWTYLKPLFHMEYDTSRLATVVQSAPARGSGMWLHVYAQFQAPPIGTNTCWRTPQPVEVPSNWKPLAVDLLKINIPNTDVILGVQAATQDKGLISRNDSVRRVF